MAGKHREVAKAGIGFGVALAITKAGGETAILCHKGKKTMELPVEVAGAHIDHGDRYGPC